MAQTFYTDCYNKNRNVGTDMDRIETNFSTLKSLFSGTAAPGSNIAGMPWFDTTKKILKIRNQANSAWLGVLYSPVTDKYWKYVNSAADGWVVDASVTDRVIALKGGTAAYNTTGGNIAGDWTTIYTHTHSHTHSFSGSHNHQWSKHYNGGYYQNYNRTWNSVGTLVSVPNISYDGGSGIGPMGVYGGGEQPTTYAGVGDAYTSNTSTAGTTASNAAAASNVGWRAAAAVGTLQYPNV
jgi:hypothetical protein